MSTHTKQRNLIPLLRALTPEELLTIYAEAKTGRAGALEDAPLALIIETTADIDNLISKIQ